MTNVTQFPGGKRGGGRGRPPTGNSGDRLVSMHALSQLIGVDRSTITKWAKVGGLPSVHSPDDGSGKGWVFDVKAVFEWRVDTVRREAIKQVTAVTGEDGMPLNSDERYKLARAIEKELQVGVLQGSLVFDIDVAKRRDKEIGRFGQAANAIPAKAARDINPKDQVRIQKLLQGYVDAMMRDLVEGDEDDADE